MKNNSLKKLEQSDDVEELNDILIKLSKDPSHEALDAVSYIIEDKSMEIKNKIMIKSIYDINVFKYKKIN